MRATIDWSHELLGEAERRLFRRLSLFSGGFRLEVLNQADIFAEGESLEIASRLVRHNLLRRRENESGSTRLYYMEVIREYAQEQLRESGEEEIVRRAFCQILGQVAEQAKKEFGGPRQAEAYRELSEEHENLTACLAYLHRHDGPAMARLVGNLGWYWESSGQLAEGLRWASQSQGVAPLQVAGTMARHQGDYTLAEKLYREALGLAADDQTRAQALANLAETEYRRGHYREAAQRYRESLDLAGGEAAVAAQLGLGRSLWALGESCETLLRDSLRQSQELGFLRQSGWSHNALGEVARSQRDWAAATAHFEAGAAIFEQLQDRGPRAILLQNLAFVQLVQENWEAAAVGLRLAFDHWFCCGAQHGLALSLLGLARLARHRKDAAGARQLAQLAHHLLAELNCPLDPSDRAELAALPAEAGGPEVLAVDEHLTRRIRKLTTAPALVPAHSATASPLTGREQEVLHLLAEGLSNLEIAEQLHISRHTVTVHLRTIYDKLGVHSRSAATRWAMDQRSLT
jgi:DNA-binding CsgD family transcriptional regulator/tetratricopeptide (TPR) repeat protein